MWMMAIASVVLTAGDPVALWINARDIADGATVNAPRADTYVAHAWARADRATWVEIGGQRLEVPAQGEAKDEWVWAQAGSVPLEAGPLAAQFGEGVVAAILTTNAALQPKDVLADIRVHDQPKAVRDRRALTARHTDTVFTMPQYLSRDEWEKSADVLRRRILLACGLEPMPERTPLNAHIFDRTQHDDYSVEKVYFEARPGFLVTGNLYRPVGEGPFPAVVCPHGHWQHGRLENGENGSVPGRCITLARMGFVVFSYDMIGYNDSLQFKHNWGGPREKLWGLHPFAMQLWSSIRAVDFVCELPEVDKNRIGCTGASGGGTQTFALMAVEPRIKVAAPVNMISSTMQGGCLCENAPIIRMEHSNMEIGAMMAPRPLLMVSATGDWTRETPRVEFPAIRSIYKLYGAEDRVQNVHIDAGHNYNKASREAMYRFFGKWLLDGDQWETYTEPAFTVEPDDKLRVFPDGKLPDRLPTDDELIEQIIAATRAKWDAELPKSADMQAFADFRSRYSKLFSDILGARMLEPNELDSERTGFVEREGYAVEQWIIRRRCVDDAIPAILYRGYGTEPQDAVLLVHGEGKAALADLAQGRPGPLVRTLIARGFAVLCIDTFLIGEHHAPAARTERLQIGRFMDTFQPTDMGYRVQDVLTASAFLQARGDLSGTVHFVGIDDGGVWCLLAGAIDQFVRTTVADLSGFDPEDDQAWVDRFYIPCIRAVGDVRTAAALAGHHHLYMIRPQGTAELLGAKVINALPDPETLADWLQEPPYSWLH